jgi:hypothetical protein
MLVSKKHIILRHWREHLQNMQDFKNSAFALIAHPEATPEQIGLVVFKAREMQKEHNEMKHRLIKEGYEV